MREIRELPLVSSCLPTELLLHPLGPLPADETYGWDEEVLVRKHVADLQRLAGLAAKVGGYRQLLAGMSYISDPPPCQPGGTDPNNAARMDMIPTEKILRGLGLYEKNYFWRPDGHTLRNLTGHNDLLKNHPAEHYKFYLSLDLTTPEQRRFGSEFFEEIAARAHNSGITLATKAWVHAYDALLLYTFQPQALAEILQTVYANPYWDRLYHPTPHFLQGALRGVNPDHIGYVHEPSGRPWGSHSMRMGLLGAYLDGQMQDGRIAVELYRAAADEALVNPARPYLVAPYDWRDAPPVSQPDGWQNLNPEAKP